MAPSVRPNKSHGTNKTDISGHESAAGSSPKIKSKSYNIQQAKVQPVTKSSMVALEPSIPAAYIIEKEISELNNEIDNLKFQFEILKNKLQKIETGECFDTQISPGNHDVHYFRGFMFSQPCIDSLSQENSNKIEQAKKKYLIPSTPRYNRLSQNKNYKKVLEDHKEDLPFEFVCVFWRRFLTAELTNSIITEYLSIHDLWIHRYIPAIDTFNLRTHNYGRFWGEEQSPQPTVPFEGPNATIGTASDIEMVITYNSCPVIYLDNNRFVEDPYKEHIDYKNRVLWDEKEKELFLDLFWTYPHQFQHISTYFQNKTCKDMIEYYYLTKTSEEMKARKALKVQKMGSKTKKVITEGKVERH